MSGKRIRELEGLSGTELTQRLTELRDQLFHERFRNSMRQLDNPLKIRNIRRDIARLQTLNTSVANALLALPHGERRTLTSKSFAHLEIGSAWINQTIRNANARTKAMACRPRPRGGNSSRQGRTGWRSP